MSSVTWRGPRFQHTLTASTTFQIGYLHPSMCNNLDLDCADKCSALLDDVLLSDVK